VAARRQDGDAARRAKTALQDVRTSDAGRKAEAALRDLREGDAGRKAKEAIRDLREGDAGRKAKEAIRDLRDSEAVRQGAGRRPGRLCATCGTVTSAARPRPRCATGGTARQATTSPDRTGHPRLAPAFGTLRLAPAVTARSGLPPSPHGGYSEVQGIPDGGGTGACRCRALRGDSTAT